MDWRVLYLILAVIIGALVAGYFILKKRVAKNLTAQKELVDKHKITTTILVLEKRMDKIQNAKIPGEIISQMPKIYKLRKTPIVRAKIGPQVMDLLCEKDVYDKLPEKKSVKVEMAGIYIAGISKDKIQHKGRR